MPGARKKPGKGYRYPGGKISLRNILGSGGVFGGGGSTQQPNVDDNLSGDDFEDVMDEGDDVSSQVSSNPYSSIPEPPVNKDGFWKSLGMNLATHGQYGIDQMRANQNLQQAQYQAKLQAYIKSGDLASAQKLAEMKGAQTALNNQAKFQQDKELLNEKGLMDALSQQRAFGYDSAMQGVKTEDTLNINDRQALGNRGYVGPSAIQDYAKLGGFEKTVNTDKAAATEAGLKNNYLNSPIGAEGFVQSLASQYAKGGVDNAKTAMETKLAPLMKLGAGDSLVNAIKPESSFLNIGGRTDKVVDAKGLPTGGEKYVAPQVLMIDAANGTGLRVKPKAEVIPSASASPDAAIVPQAQSQLQSNPLDPVAPFMMPPVSNTTNQPASNSALVNALLRVLMHVQQ